MIILCYVLYYMTFYWALGKCWTTLSSGEAKIIYILLYLNYKFRFQVR